MRPVQVLALALVCLALTEARSEEPRDPTPVAISVALDRGVAYLRSQQAADGTWQDGYRKHGYLIGETAFPTLVLLRCGVPADDPAVTRAFAWMFEQRFTSTYDVALAILALEARHAPPPSSKVPYRTAVRKNFQKDATPAEREWLKRAVEYLLANQTESGLFRYHAGQSEDLSNAQFALYALKAARRLGLGIDPEVWRRSLVYLLENQEADGPRVPAFDIPAAEGPIAEEKNPERRPRTTAVLRARAAIRDGCAWLAQTFDPTENPKSGRYLLYYLYLVERCSALAGFERLGEHDWYMKGARYILDGQGKDGGIHVGAAEGTLAGTCEALLFLRRASVPLIQRTATTSGSGAAPARPLPPPSR